MRSQKLVPFFTADFSLSSSVLKYLVNKHSGRPVFISCPAARSAAFVPGAANRAASRLPITRLVDQRRNVFRQLLLRAKLGNEKSEDFSNMNAIARTTSSELKAPIGFVIRT